MARRTQNDYHALFKRWQEGDSIAQTELYRQFKTIYEGQLLEWLGYKETAYQPEDIYDEAWMSLIKKHKKDRLRNVNNFRLYFRKVLYNKFLKHSRSMKLKVSYEDHIGDQSEDDHEIEKFERKDQVAKYIDSLKENERLVFIYKSRGYTNVEIGKTLNLSVNQVRGAFDRAKIKLKKQNKITLLWC